MALSINRQKHFVNGLITNDKFCLIRRGQIKLQWSRNPYRFRPRKSQYAPDETSHQGGYHETPVADTASVSANGRRGTTLGSRLPVSHAMESTDRGDHRSRPLNPPQDIIGARLYPIIGICVTIDRQ